MKTVSNMNLESIYVKCFPTLVSEVQRKKICGVGVWTLSNCVLEVDKGKSTDLVTRES